MKRRAVLLAITLWIVSLVPSVEGQTTRCEGLSGYERGLCLFANRSYSEAERSLAAVVEENREDPVTLKARYFLIRSQMKLRKWKEASDQLIAIYSISPMFYREWSCDFLLGECRRNLGQE